MLQHLHKNKLNLIAREEPSRAGMTSVAKHSAAGVDGHELVLAVVGGACGGDLAHLVVA